MVPPHDIGSSTWLWFFLEGPFGHLLHGLVVGQTQRSCLLPDRISGRSIIGRSWTLWTSFFCPCFLIRDPFFPSPSARPIDGPSPPPSAPLGHETLSVVTAVRKLSPELSTSAFFRGGARISPRCTVRWGHFSAHPPKGYGVSPRRR